MEKIPEGTARDCSRGVYSWGVSAPGGGGCLLLEGVGDVYSGGCLLLGGVCSQGVSAPGRCLLPGVSAPGGCLHLGGVCSWGVSAPGGHLLLRGVGWYPSMH